MKRSSTWVRCVRRSAALAVIGAFLFVPTLARLHDRLSTADTRAGFKLSKNIERPHDKQAPVPLVPITAVSLDADTSLECLVAVLSVRIPASPVDARLSNRAPPRL